jgi:hypothetical protein
MIWAFIYSNLIGNSIGLNICGMWGLSFGVTPGQIQQVQ